jgi:hypothetical protein
MGNELALKGACMLNRVRITQCCPRFLLSFVSATKFKTKDWEVRVPGLLSNLAYTFQDELPGTVVVMIPVSWPEKAASFCARSPWWIGRMAATLCVIRVVCSMLGIVSLQGSA